jgi:predicted MPP superfamily phosphohydrolase
MFFGKKQTGLESLLNRQRPSAWQRFLSQPCVFLARYLYTLRHVTQEIPLNHVSIVCISDTHNSQPNLPPGDILIHAGDLTQSGSLEELEAAIAWLNSQPHLHKIVVGGNHDILLDRNCDRSK